MRLIENCSSAKFGESLGLFCFSLLENNRMFGHRGTLFKKNKPKHKQKRTVAVSDPVQILEAPGRAKSSLRSPLLTWTQTTLFPEVFI